MTLDFIAQIFQQNHNDIILLQRIDKESSRMSHHPLELNIKNKMLKNDSHP